MSKKVLTGVSNNVTENIDKIKVWPHSASKGWCQKIETLL